MEKRLLYKDVIKWGKNYIGEKTIWGRDNIGERII